MYGRKKIKNIYIIIGIVVIVALAVVLQGVSSIRAKDKPVVKISAEFVGKVPPKGIFTRGMFHVSGTTQDGLVVRIKNFTVSSQRADANGASCTVDVSSQGYTSTVVVPITRQEESFANIGYGDKDNVKVTFYKNGDLEFSGSGAVKNLGSSLPWAGLKYTHVYIDDTIDLTDIDNWFKGNKNLVYCSPLPKTVKTMRSAFKDDTALVETPEYFQCKNLKFMNDAFSGCTALESADTLPVNLKSASGTFTNCTTLTKVADMSKTSNLTDISNIYSGCSGLRETGNIPETVTNMSGAFQNCLNISSASMFPKAVKDISSAYSGCAMLASGMPIPESATDISNCYAGCSNLAGTLEINTDTPNFSGCLTNACTMGDTLLVSGNSGNLLEIVQNSGSDGVSLADAEAAAAQNARMVAEQGTDND